MTTSGPEHGSLGQQAYEAYGDEVGWMNYEGKTMPAWIYLPNKIKNGWHAAAARIVEQVR
jgi:hypothetical protein